jgi:predicted secreted Zn-dependent protease
MLAETFQITVTPVARVRPGTSQTATLLAHEQGHYDIGLLAARVMARDLQSLRAANRAALATALQNSFTLHTVTRLGPIQQRYDLDTSHGTNHQQQQRWETSIRSCLSDPNCSQINGLLL